MSEFSWIEKKAEERHIGHLNIEVVEIDGEIRARTTADLGTGDVKVILKAINEVVEMGSIIGSLSNIRSKL